MSSMPPAARARYEASLLEALAVVADGRPGVAGPLVETAHVPDLRHRHVHSE